MAAGALALAACDAGTPETQPVDAPKPKLLDVHVTTSNDAAGTPLQESIGVGAAVSPRTSFRLSFDRFLLPASVIRQSVCLRSASGPLETPDQCTGGTRIDPSYDPVRREIIYRQQPGTQLAADTQYQLTVFGAVEPASAAGIRAFDGAPLEQKAYQLTFKTIAVEDPVCAPIAPATTSPCEELPPSTDFWCANNTCAANAVCVAGVCTGSPSVENLDCTTTACADLCGEPEVRRTLSDCGSTTCHGGGGTTTVAMGLNLQGEGLGLTAIGHVAHQTMTGENADEADLAPVLGEPRRFGRAMPIISPNNPGNSYLVYKLIAGTERPAFANDPFFNDGSLPPIAAGEIDRLRAALVVGMPMPPEAPLQLSKIAQISQWIAQGAPAACK